MTLPTISQYLDAVATLTRRLRTLGDIEPLIDARGEVVFYAGNSAAVFPLKGDRVLRCYIKPPLHAREIYSSLADDPLLTPLTLLRDEIFVHDALGDGAFHDVLAGEWVAGITLEAALRRASREGGFDTLSEEFERLAAALLGREWAHGDLKPENIIVRTDGSMCLVDYDAMWVPALEGLPTSEVGTPQYQHPARDEKCFCKAIDDFPIALIAVSLRALVLDPSLYGRHNRGDNIIMYASDAAAGTGAAWNDIMELFTHHGQWHSIRLAIAMQTPAPQIEGISTLLSANPAAAVADFATPFSDGLAVAGALGRWKIIRHDGSIHATLDDYDTVKPLSEGVAAVRRGELWGFVDSGGNTLAAPQFQLAGSMREGLAVVKKEGRYGYVDRRGRLAIEAIYDYAVSFRNGRATVSSGGESYEIGPRGERI